MDCVFVGRIRYRSGIRATLCPWGSESRPGVDAAVGVCQRAAVARGRKRAFLPGASSRYRAGQGHVGGGDSPTESPGSRETAVRDTDVTGGAAKQQLQL